jgi:hypothetical protein
MATQFAAVTELLVDKLKKDVVRHYGDRVKGFEREAVLAILVKDNRESIQSQIAYVNAEIQWAKQRPFFNLHPPVINSLANTPLTITPRSIPRSIVHELGVICVKIPVGFRHKLIRGVSHFFVTIASGVVDPVTKKTKHQDAVGVYYMEGDTVSHTWCEMDEAFTGLRDGDMFRNSTFEMEQRRFFEKLTLGIMLLAADPDFVQPILLKRDQGKAGDRKKMAERARRNGVFGFDIGANMDVSPHFRRPHFAIRWTGKGAEAPKLVPVKGAVIHRDALKVPTGFESQTAGEKQ